MAIQSHGTKSRSGWLAETVTAFNRATIRLTISHARFFVVWDIVERGLSFRIVVIEPHDFTVQVSASVKSEFLLNAIVHLPFHLDNY